MICILFILIEIIYFLLLDLLNFDFYKILTILKLFVK